MKIAVLAITSGGKLLADKIVKLHDTAVHVKKIPGQRTAELMAHLWQDYDAFVCIMATGIAVRSIAPLLQDKTSDPCVIVIDEKANNVISLLSGHLGGGNELTLDLARLLGANPVITTATDTLGLVALDLWALANKLVVPEKKELTRLSTKLVNDGFLRLYSDVEFQALPSGLVAVTDPFDADFIVSHRLYDEVQCPAFRPLNLIVGTGCNRGTPVKEFESALRELFHERKLSTKSIRNLASIDKKNDEVGLLQFAASHDWSIDFFEKESLNKQNNLEISYAALKAVGAIGVAEPASLLSANSKVLLSRKRKWKNVTMAIAQAPFMLLVQAPDQQSR